jgi:sialate O-acetylesterase
MQDNPNFPTVLYNGMIQPLVPYGVKGAIWYQGESNAGQAYQYRTLLPTMINSWHNNWKQGDFPFLIVQLAGFGAAPAQPGDDAWAELREAQWLTAKNVRNAGIMTAIDIGESSDIHPKNKQEVGRRLALVAEKQVYHMPVVSSGPVYKSMKIEDAGIRLSFDHMDGGLVSKGGRLKGFSVAGEDHKWHWAAGVIDGNTILVYSRDVQHPVAVRYNWATYYTANLYNGAGLPAFPFRTDDWKEITGGPK